MSPRPVPASEPVILAAVAGDVARQPDGVVDTAVVAMPVARTREVSEAADGADLGPRTTCTVAQLRRFIKSRPWVPMHELRRRFGINGADDDVTPIRVGDLRLFIGMPAEEGRLMGELLGSGDVGYELSLDPGAPIVVGVYPMRPVPRS